MSRKRTKKHSFDSFRFWFTGGIKNFIQKKRDMILCLNELIDLFSWKFSESVNHISYSTQKGAQNREVSR